MVQRRNLAWLLLLLVSVPGAVAGGTLQTGYNAARQGVDPDGEPVADEDAFFVQLPGSRARRSVPFVEDGTILVLVKDERKWSESLNQNAIVAVDADSATIKTVVEFPTKPFSFAADEERFYVLLETGVSAYPRRGGDALWQLPYPPLWDSQETVLTCMEPALEGDWLYVVCSKSRAATTPDYYRTKVLVAAVHRETGVARWISTYPPAPHEAGGVGVGPSQRNPSVAAASVVRGFAVIDGTLVMMVSEAEGAAFEAGGATTGKGQAAVGINAVSGRLSWVYRPPAEPPSLDMPFDSVLTVDATGFTPVGADNVAYFFIAQRLVAVNAATGAVLWADEVGKEDSRTNLYGGMALQNTTLAAATRETIYVYDTLAQKRVWSWRVSGVGEIWSSSPLVVSGNTLYARAEPPASGGTHASILYQIDIHDRRLIARSEAKDTMKIPEQPGVCADASRSWDANRCHVSAYSLQSVERHQFGIGGGILATAGWDGALYVRGESQASPVPVARPNTLFPGPGRPVSVDMRESGPGIEGPVTEFSADWGDGTRSSWTAGPILTHVYSNQGAYEARFRVRNDAGQTASRYLTFDVGGSDPAAQPFLAKAFSREHQDATFFVLGLCVTAGGAIFGFSRVHRSRGRLVHEMRAVDAVFELAKGRPAEADMALVERRAHARGLLVDGKITESQYGILDSHIGDLSRRVRLQNLHDDFPFLPIGIARPLESMLQDGSLSNVEMTRIKAMVGEDASMSPRQKASVLSRLESWYSNRSRDANARTWERRRRTRSGRAG